MVHEPAEQILRKIRSLEAEERELSRRLEGVCGQVSGLRQALDILRATMGAREIAGDLSRVPERPAYVRHRALPDPATNARWASILRIIHSAPAEGISSGDLVRKVGKEGHSLPRGVARRYLSTAAKHGVIRRVAKGRYVDTSMHCDERNDALD